MSIALYFLFQSTTGVLLAFRHELQATGSESGISGVDPIGAISIQTALDRFRVDYPELAVDRIYYPEVYGEPYIAHLRAPDGSSVRLAEVDSQTGEVRDASIVIRVLNLVFDLHHELSLGKAGSYLVGLLGLALLLSAVTGTWLWWPGLRRLGNAFTVKLRGAGVRSIFDWHRLTGSAIAPIIVTSAITGILLAYGGVLRSALGVSAVPVRAATQFTTESAINADTLISIADAALSNGGVRDLRFSGNENLLNTVVFFPDNQNRSGPFNRVWIDPHSGEVLGVSDSDRLDAGNRFFAWVYPVHTELGLGETGRAINTAGGIGLLLLSITGPLLWWRKKNRRSKN